MQHCPLDLLGSPFGTTPLKEAEQKMWVRCVRIGQNGEPSSILKGNPDDTLKAHFTGVESSLILCLQTVPSKYPSKQKIFCLLFILP